MTGMWGYVLWAGRGDVPPSAPRDDRTRESGTKESFAMETTGFAKTRFGTEKGTAWALEPVIEGKNPRQTGRSRLLTPVFCSDATHPHPRADRDRGRRHTVS